jgi:hypothetical protein
MVKCFICIMNIKYTALIEFVKSAFNLCTSPQSTNYNYDRKRIKNAPLIPIIDIICMIFQFNESETLPLYLMYVCINKYN